MKARTMVVFVFALSASSSVRGEPSPEALRLQGLIEPWAERALLTVWNGKTYSDRTCFAADGTSVSCGSPGVVQLKEETGVEYAITVGSRTDVPLDCSIRGGSGSAIPFSLPVKGASHTEIVRVPATAKQAFQIICEASLERVLASSGAAGRARIAVLHDVKAGKTTRRATVVK